MNFDFLVNTGEFKREVADWRRIRGNDKLEFGIAEPVARNAQRVVARRNSVNLETPFAIGNGGALPIRLFGVEFDLCSLDWAMLNVMNDAAHRAENAGARFDERKINKGKQAREQEREPATAKHGIYSRME